MKRLYLILLIIVVTALIFGGCAQPAPSPAPAPSPTATPKPTSAPAPKAELPKAAGIATHPKGSSYNAIGAGIAKIISLHTPISTTDRPFAAVTSWISLLNSGEIEMGMIGNTDLWKSTHGVEPYTQAYKNVRLIAGGTDNVVGWVVRGDSGIKTFAQLKGKKLAFQQEIADIILAPVKANGLDPNKDIIKVPATGVTGSVDALMEGRVDAAWASVGMAKIQEAIAKIGNVTWLPVAGSEDDAAAKMIRELLPGMAPKFFKAGSQPTLVNDAVLMTLSGAFVTHKGFSEEAVYVITKALAGSQAELTPIHPMFEGWVRAMVSETLFAPYHPGAIRYYQEAGLWSNKIEEIQKKLLTEFK